MSKNVDPNQILLFTKYQKENALRQFVSRLNRLTCQYIFTLVGTLALTVGVSQIPLENDPGNASPGGYFDKVFDRLGVEYKLSDLDIAKKMAGSGVEEVCEAGYFMLHFETGSLLPGNQE